MISTDLIGWINKRILTVGKWEIARKIIDNYVLCFIYMTT